jgi:paired amphipathic helix protein Sin3a
VAHSYCQVLYSRLALFKGIAAKSASEPPRPPKANPVTSDPDATGGPNASSWPANAEHFYQLMLDSCKKLFDNDIEQPAFEDQMRWMFGTKVCQFVQSYLSVTDGFTRNSMPIRFSPLIN